MKNIILCLSLAVVISATSQNGAYLEYRITTTAGFNGSVKVNYSEFGTASVFNMIIPQMPGGGFTNKTLMLKDKPGLVYTLDDKNKTYSEIKSTDTQDNKTYAVKKLGEEVVNGYKCTHALVTEGTDTHEVWYTKDMPDYSKYAEAINSNNNVGSKKREAALKAAGCEGVPVKTVHISPSQGTMTMDLTKMEKRTYKKSEFVLPANYRAAGSGGGASKPNSQIKTTEEIQKMTPEERAKYIEELKKTQPK